MTPYDTAIHFFRAEAKRLGLAPTGYQLNRADGRDRSDRRRWVCAECAAETPAKPVPARGANNHACWSCLQMCNESLTQEADADRESRAA